MSNKDYENKLTNEEKRVVYIVEERGISNYSLKYKKIFEGIIYYINKQLRESSIFVKGKFKQKYDVNIFNFLIPTGITKYIDIFENLNLTISVFDISTDDEIEETLYGNNSGSYKLKEKENLNFDNTKLENGEINISCFAKNHKIIKHTLITPLLHELNHATDNLERLKKYKIKNLFNVFNEYNYNNIKKLRDSKNNLHSIIGIIIYRLWLQSERSALITSVYSDLKELDSKRSNFIRDIWNTKAGKIYKQIKYEYLPQIKDISENDIELYCNIINAPKSIKTKIQFIDYFNKKTNLLLSDFLKHIGKVASLYYDENEVEREKNNPVKKYYENREFLI